jgi:hypothetical protein
MAKPKEVLSPADYANYRNVRAAALLFVVLGSVLILGGIGLATDQKPEPQRDVPPAAAIGIAIVGLAGVVGGIAALRGNRRWAILAYVMAVPYLLGFPIGTILSYVVLSGMSQYLDSKERIKQATIDQVEGEPKQ